MGKRSRRSRPQRQSPRAINPTPPLHSEPPHGLPAIRERLLLQAIADGELDPHLEALAQAIHARRHLLHTVATHTALAQLCVGDEVQIDNTVRPQYLRGLRGSVLEIDDERVTICVHRPVGRFTSGEIRCPPLILKKLSKAA